MRNTILTVLFLTSCVQPTTEQEIRVPENCTVVLHLNDKVPNVEILDPNGKTLKRINIEE